MKRQSIRDHMCVLQNEIVRRIWTETSWTACDICKELEMDHSKLRVGVVHFRRVLH